MFSLRGEGGWGLDFIEEQATVVVFFMEVQWTLGYPDTPPFLAIWITEISTFSTAKLANATRFLNDKYHAR